MRIGGKPSTVKSCGKARFRDDLSAKAALRTLSLHRQEGVILPVRAYKCKCCKGWHLTSQEKRD